MAEPIVYFATLALFSFVTIASALMRHEMLILACIPPVFVALIMGFVMAIYASDAFGGLPTAASLVVGVPPGWWLARRLKPGRLLLVIYLVWLVALALALVAFGFPDRR